MSLFSLVGVLGCSSQVSDGAGGGGGGSGGSGVTSSGLESPSFAEVYAKIIEPGGCASDYCHGHGDLVLHDQATAYASLVGKATTQEGCGGAVRVVPGAPEGSVFYLKLSEEKPACGSRMPIGKEPFGEAELSLVRAWIAGGARE
ncbi:MAG: hypothetical protein QM820_33600 [Minicystis sp.]